MRLMNCALVIGLGLAWPTQLFAGSLAPTKPSQLVSFFCGANPCPGRAAASSCVPTPTPAPGQAAIVTSVQVFGAILPRPSAPMLAGFYLETDDAPGNFIAISATISAPNGDIAKSEVFPTGLVVHAGRTLCYEPATAGATAFLLAQGFLTIDR